MASSTTFFLLLLVVSFLAAATANAETARASEAMVGGRTEIKDAGSNKEVQSLGKFAVVEHNRRLHNGGGGGSDDPVRLQLAFTRVVAAQKQVVAGVAYYLKIVARDRAGGGDRPFDAVVVVKAWLKSKELVSFKPSPK